MIRLGKITYSQTDTKSQISLPVFVKGKEESLYIEADLDYGKFFVTDRCDAFVTGILYAAMFLNEDIVCEMPVSGELKYMLEQQFITTLANHSNQFHKIKISSEVTNEPLQNLGGVGTGLSMGLDSFCTIADTYNTDNKSINLTHLMTFNNGILGGFYNNNGKEFCESKLYKNILKVSSQLGLPLISINSNMTDFMSKYYSKRVDYFLTNILVGVIMSLGHLFEKYYISSVGLDFSYFSIKDAAFRDVETFDLFTLYCCSIAGGVRFIVGSGEKNRYEKMKTIRTFDVARQNLQSCLTEHYNCMNCQKCKRNLVTLDALGCLDEFSEVYDIEYYRKNRNRYIEWMCQQVQMNNHASDYIIPAYNIIKKREPELINSLTVSNDMLISQKNEMKRQRNVYRSYGLLLRKSLTSPDWKEKTSEWFKRNNIKNVVIYGYNLLTLSLLELRESLKINIVSIIYNKKPNDKISVPVLPENTTDYPDCDAVIVSNVDIPELLKKKISYLTDAPIYLISEIFNLK